MLGQQEIRRKQLELERKRKAMEAQIAVLRAEYEAEETEALKAVGLVETRYNRLLQDRIEMAKSRKADVAVKTTGKNRKQKK